MKTITVNASEPVYEEFQRAARRLRLWLGRPSSSAKRWSSTGASSSLLAVTCDSSCRYRSAASLRPLTGG